MAISYVNLQLSAMIENQEKMLKNMQKMMKANADMMASNQKLAKSMDEVEEGIDKSNKKLTIFGKIAAGLTSQKLAPFRRFLYGFGAQGIFRGINKVASSFEQLDFVLRKLGGGKGAKALKFLTPKIDFSKFDRMSSQIKGAQTAQQTYFGRSASAQARMRTGIGVSALPTDAAERQMIGRRKAERTLRRKRALEVGGMITGIRRRQEPAGGGIKKAAKQFIDVLNNTDFGKIFQLIKKHVVKAAILVSAIIFKTIAFVVLFYMIFKAFGPQIMDALKATWEAIKAVGMVAMAGLMVVWDGLKDIWSAFFGDGDLMTLIDGLLKVAGGLLLFVAGLAITAITAGLVLLGVLLKETGQRFVNFIGDYFSSAMSWVNRIAVTIALIAGYVLFVASGAWAAMIAAAIGFYVAKKLMGLFGFHANGGMVSTPMQVVGERGPELVSLPRGSRVHTNAESKRMAAGGGNTFNITINARDTSDAELRRIADKIGQMINGRINRNTSSRTLGA